MPKGGPASDAFDGKHLLIAESPCDECLFSKNKIVSDRRKREILRQCYIDGTYFICHKSTVAGRAVICLNFAKSTEGAGNQSIRVAQYFNFIQHVDPSSGKPTASGKASETPGKPSPTSRRR